MNAIAPAETLDLLSPLRSSPRVTPNEQIAGKIRLASENSLRSPMRRLLIINPQLLEAFRKKNPSLVGGPRNQAGGFLPGAS
jgi:hypothetical protein